MKLTIAGQREGLGAAWQRTYSNLRACWQLDARMEISLHIVFFRGSVDGELVGFL